MRNWTEKPNSVPWPPILFLCAAGAAFGLGIVYPLGTAALTGDFPRGVGIAAMLAGLGLDIAAMLTMRREHANILPHRAATALVTKGPFALSRNPIYLGNTLLLGGAGFVFANAWLLLAAAAACAGNPSGRGASRRQIRRGLGGVCAADSALAVAEPVSRALGSRRQANASETGLFRPQAI